MEDILKDLLVDKKIKVVPILRKGSWLPKGHDGEFMNVGAKKEMGIPINKMNVKIDPLEDLTLAQKDALATLIGLKVTELNVHNKDSIWNKRRVKINRSGLSLHLQDPYSFIDYRILKVNSDKIAPSWEERLEKAYIFALVNEDDVANKNAVVEKDKLKAYEFFGRLQTSRSKMNDFLNVYYIESKDAKRVPVNATEEFLISEIGKIVNGDTIKFLDIMKDPYYDTKVLIQKALKVGALIKDKHNYSIVGADSSIGTLQETVKHLEDLKYQEDRLKLEAHIDIDKEDIKEGFKKCQDCGKLIPKFPPKRTLCPECKVEK